MRVNKNKFDEASNEFFRSGLENANLDDRITTEEVIVWFDKVPNKKKVQEVYWIEPPFCFASISEDDGETVYETYEAIEQDADIKNFVLDSIGYELSKIDIDYPKLFDACDSMLNMIENEQLENKNYADLYNARKDSSGFMMLYPYTKDAKIEDLSYNGDGSLFVYHNSEYRSIPSNLKIPQKEVDQFLTQLLDNFSHKADGKLVDKNLTDNERILVTFGSDDGLENTTFTLRTDDAYAFTPIDLYESGTYSSTAISYLWMAVDNDMSVLFGGGTASGKTSTLEAILFFTENNQQIISVEDRQELSIPHKNWIPKNNNVNDENIDISDLLMSSIRQRPKYTVLDEIRSGSEAQTLFQAISTGHTSYSTMHADSVDTIINRLTNPPINVPKQMVMAIDIICVQNQLKVDSESEPTKRIKDVREIVSLNNEQLQSKRPFHWDSKTDEFTNSIEDSYVVEEISRLNQMSTEEVVKEIKRREKIIEEMSRSNIKDAESVREIITMYQDNSELVTQRLESEDLEKLI